MIDLGAKAAVVTGGSRGIGRAIALRLATQGADVAFSYRGNEDAASDTAAAIEGLGEAAPSVKPYIVHITCVILFGLFVLVLHSLQRSASGRAMLAGPAFAATASVACLKRSSYGPWRSTQAAPVPSRNSR